MRKNKEDTEITRQTIMKVAYETFLQYGYDKTTLSYIANAAGVTRGAIYWHFSEKRDLYIQVVEGVLANMAEYKRTLLKNTTLDEKAQLISTLSLPLQHHDEYQFISRALLLMPDHSDLEDLNNTIYKSKRRLYDYFMDTIQQGMKKGTISKKYPANYIANTIYMVFEGIHSYTIEPMGQKKIDEDYLKNLVDMLID